MYWPHVFEALCYVLAAGLCVECVSGRRWSDLKLFAAGALAGFVLEMLAVRMTGIYHYNPTFRLNIGSYPDQFPVFGGLMWGALSVASVRIARRLGLDHVRTALAAGFLVLSMDLLLDVVAIRLEGGFWQWEGRDILPVVDHRSWMGAIWVNFLGYLFETPMVAWLFLKDCGKGPSRPWWAHLLSILAIALGGIAFVGVCSAAALLLDRLTAGWFPFVAFTGLWLYILYIIIAQLKSRGTSGDRERYAATVFTALYVYCLAALVHMHWSRWPLYVLGAALLALTLYMAFSKPRQRK